MLTPYILALLAILLAWPVPFWLQRSGWPSRAPGAALVLWQAIGISGGLALVTSPLTWGLQPFGTGIVSAAAELQRVFRESGLEGIIDDTRWAPLGLAAVTLSCLLFGHLTLVLVHTAYATFTQRKRHRDFVEVLAASLQDHDHGMNTVSKATSATRVLPVEHPLAYCLPAMNEPLTVVSRGLVNELSSRQLAAVLAHESAHLTQRHDLLRLAFQAWHKAAPWFPATGVAVKEVTELTEIMADDHALSTHDRHDLITALAHTLAVDSQPNALADAPLTEPDAVVESRRLQRLVKPGQPLKSYKVILVTIWAGLLVTVPAVISLL